MPRDKQWTAADKMIIYKVAVDAHQRWAKADKLLEQGVADGKYKLSRPLPEKRKCGAYITKVFENVTKSGFNFEVKKRSGLPRVYDHDKLQEDIRKALHAAGNGKLKSLQHQLALTSQRALAKQLGVSPKTVQNMISKMKSEKTFHANGKAAVRKSKRKPDDVEKAGQSSSSQTLLKSQPQRKRAKKQPAATSSATTTTNIVDNHDGGAATTNEHCNAIDVAGYQTAPTRSQAQELQVLSQHFSFPRQSVRFAAP